MTKYNFGKRPYQVNGAQSRVNHFIWRGYKNVSSGAMRSVPSLRILALPKIRMRGRNREKDPRPPDKCPERTYQAGKNAPSRKKRLLIAADCSIFGHRRRRGRNVWRNYAQSRKSCLKANYHERERENGNSQGNLGTPDILAFYDARAHLEVPESDSAYEFCSRTRIVP